MKKLFFLAATSLIGACSWSQFDDLSDTTTVRGTEKPDGIKATEYGVSIAGATLPAETSGGKIAILSSGSGNYSTLALDPGGIAQDLGANETLGAHTIDSVTAKGTVLFDGVGQVVLVDNSNVGTVVAVSGSPDALSLDQQIPTPATPDATAFANGQLVVGVTSSGATAANIFSAKGTAVRSCLFTDGTTAGAPAAVAPAAVAIDSSMLWVYTKAGDLFGYPLTALDTCVVGTPTGPTTAKVSGPAATNNGHLAIITEGTSKYAILTAYDTAATSIGAIQLVNITTAATPVLAGSVISAPGVRAAAYDTFDGSGVLVLGYPGRANGSTSGAGAVDLHTVTGGAIAATASGTLQIPNGDSNHLFGRAVTTTRYNGQPIVVVAADNVVYSFYQTSLYAKR